MRVERIRDPQIAAVEAHLRACYHSEPLGEIPMLDDARRMLGGLLSHARVMPGGSQRLGSGFRVISHPASADR